MSQVKKNFLYNIMYNILVLIIPLITAPYLSRVIGASSIGIFSYSYSIAQYFVLFAMLGLANYGNRSIAKVRDNQLRLNKEFSSIYSLQLITSTIIILLYMIFLIFIKEDKIVFIIQLIYVLSVLFDVSWLFFGVEKFKTTVLRNSIIKILSTISIFVFVQTKSDLKIYILINALSIFLSQFILWLMARKIVKYEKPTKKDIMKHLLPNLKLFIPVLAISLYNIMDKVMLGIIVNKTQVGYYENAEKIIQIPITVISALGTVMLPRITNLLAKGKTEQVKKYIDDSMKFIMFISIPISVGLITIGKDFCIIYFGKDFYTTGKLVEILGCVIIFKSWANIIRTQYLIPFEKDFAYILSVCLGAVFNLIFNLLFISKLGAIGACVGTIIAEFSVMSVQTIYVLKELNIRNYIVDSIKFILKAAIMGGAIIFIGHFYLNGILRIVFQVSMGILLYMLLNYGYVIKLLKNIKIGGLKK